MINFRDEDQRKVLVYFAKTLGNELVLSVAKQEREVTTKEEARELAGFYWLMVDKAVEIDKQQQKVEGILGMQAIMEDFINIIGGYLERNGFAEQWDEDDD